MEKNSRRRRHTVSFNDQVNREIMEDIEEETSCFTFRRQRRPRRMEQDSQIITSNKASWPSAFQLKRLQHRQEKELQNLQEKHQLEQQHLQRHQRQQQEELREQQQQQWLQFILRHQHNHSTKISISSDHSVTKDSISLPSQPSSIDIDDCSVASGMARYAVQLSDMQPKLNFSEANTVKKLSDLGEIKSCRLNTITQVELDENFETHKAIIDSLENPKQFSG